MSVTHSFRVLVHLFGGCSIALHFNFSRCINSLSFSLFLSQSEELILFKFLFVVYYCYFKKIFFWTLGSFCSARLLAAILERLWTIVSNSGRLTAISEQFPQRFSCYLTRALMASFGSVSEAFTSGLTAMKVSARSQSSFGAVVAANE